MCDLMFSMPNCIVFTVGNSVIQGTECCMGLQSSQDSTKFSHICGVL